MKKYALNNIPLKKRFSVSGSLSVNATEPFIASGVMQLGFWLNQRFILGGGLTLRKQFEKPLQSINKQIMISDGYGIMGFTKYYFSNSLFLVGEYEITKNIPRFDEGIGQKSWANAYRIGLGNELNVGPLLMSIMVLYDLNHTNNQLNSQPINLKLGYRMNNKN